MQLRLEITRVEPTATSATTTLSLEMLVTNQNCSENNCSCSMRRTMAKMTTTMAMTSEMERSMMLIRKVCLHEGVRPSRSSWRSCSGVGFPAGMVLNQDSTTGFDSGVGSGGWRRNTSHHMVSVSDACLDR